MALFVSQPENEQFDRLAEALAQDPDLDDGKDNQIGKNLPDGRFKEPDPKDWVPPVLPPRRRRYSLEAAYRPALWENRRMGALRRKIWLTFEEPGYSPVALVVNLGVTLLILIAITAFTLETSREYYGREVAPFPQIEVFCTTVFSIEVVLRAGSCPDICAFVQNWWNIADLLAILPYYLELIAHASSKSYAVVRVVRLVRLLKLVRYGQRNKKMGGMLRVFRETMQESESNLKMMIMFELLTAVICGAVTYYIERGTFHKSSQACSGLLPPGHTYSTQEAFDRCHRGPEMAGLCQYVSDAVQGEQCVSMTAVFCDGVDRLGADCQAGQQLLEKTWYYRKNVRQTVGWARDEHAGDCVALDGSTACDSADDDETACLMRGLTDEQGTACEWAGHTVAEAMGRAGEQEVDRQAMFSTIFTGMYWTLVTVTGVGYGDMVPTSVAGKFATFITILMGLLLIALPVSVIGGNFQACYMRLIDVEAKKQSESTAAAAAFEMAGLRRRLRNHREGVVELRRENPLPHESGKSDRRGSIAKATMQIQDAGTKVADSPSKKRKDAKNISLGGVRTTRDLARRLAPSNICASMYVEHLLRALHIADDHFFEAMNDCVTDQFIGVLRHTQQHVIDERDKGAYDAEAAAWSADLWAQTGSGLPSSFHDDRRRNSIATKPAAAGGSEGAAAGADGESQELPDASEDFASMSAAELSAEVDSLLSMSGYGNQTAPDTQHGGAGAGASGRQPRQP